MGNIREAQCQECGKAFKWLVGDAMVCPNCGHVNIPQPSHLEPAKVK